jgi:signal transduction histidine kinase
VTRAPGGQGLFEAEIWERALTRYSAATHLTVVVVRADGDRPFGPIVPTPVFDLLAASSDPPDLFAACAWHCLAEPAGAAPVVERRHSLAVVGTPLTLEGQTVGAAVAGYVVTAFPDQREVQRLAREIQVPFADLRTALRREPPLTHQRLLVYGELLQTLCDSITESKEAESALRRARDELERRVGERTVELAAAVDALQEENVERKRAEAELQSSRDRLRELTFHVEAAREEERVRIAHEIHDELGQALTALKLDLARLAPRLRPEQKVLIESTATMVAIANTAIESVRRITTELRTPVLDDLGLVAALEWQAQEFEQRTGIACRLTETVGGLAAGPALDTALFRICQEILSNVTRHASATAVEIRLEEDGGAVVLTVRDNGRGITDSEQVDRRSLGLLAIRERAALLGGEATIVGRPGEGTSVTLRLPLTLQCRG